jgi:hypothetical protein
MPVEIKITGAEQLRALGRDLRAAGEEGKLLRRELLATMRLAGKPLAEATRQSALDMLPHTGGLNEFIADSKIVARNSLTGSRVGTRIVGKKTGGSKGAHDLEAMDVGTFRHPVYGHRSAWVQQSVRPGWFTKPLEDAAPALQAALLGAMNVTAARIERF